MTICASHLLTPLAAPIHDTLGALARPLPTLPTRIARALADLLLPAPHTTHHTSSTTLLIHASTQLQHQANKARTRNCLRSRQWKQSHGPVAPALPIGPKKNDMTCHVSSAAFTHIIHTQMTPHSLPHHRSSHRPLTGSPRRCHRALGGARAAWRGPSGSCTRVAAPADMGTVRHPTHAQTHVHTHTGTPGTAW